MLSLSIDGPFGDLLEISEDNLVLRAALALQDLAFARKKSRPGAALLLTKRLPIASGIGGGSADAAATLRALDRLWALNLADREMETLALSLGADVPVCLGSRARMMSGIGENLDNVPALPPIWIVMANPLRGLDTRSVFASRSPKDVSIPLTMPERITSASMLAGWLSAETCNDLSAAAKSILPEIENIESALRALPRALYVGMSGSGATCFALFAERGEALKGAQTLRAAEPQWWVEAGEIRGNTAALP